MAIKISRNWVLALLATVSIFHGAATHAENEPDFKYAFSVTGTCKNFRFPNEETDFTKGCDGTLVYHENAYGRMGFTFLLPKAKTTVMFSGNEKNYVLTEQNTLKHQIDAVTVITDQPDGVHTNKDSATGECVYGDPFKGPALISCYAKMQGHTFKGEFSTDGKSPEVMFDERKTASSKSVSNMPYRMFLTCTTRGGVKTSPHACFVGSSRYESETSLKISQGSRSRIYHVVDIMQLARNQSVLEMPLPERFSIQAQNAAEYVTLSITIKDLGGNIVFEDQADHYGLILISN